MLTKLTLKNMIFYGHHGVYPSEKELGQSIEVDVELEANLVKAGEQDDLLLTINYVDIYLIVKKIVEKDQYNLIEAIGTEIINRIITHVGVLNEMTKITIKVRKPHPPVGGFMDAIEFEIFEDLKHS